MPVQQDIRVRLSGRKVAPALQVRLVLRRGQPALRVLPVPLALLVRLARLDRPDRPALQAIQVLRDRSNLVPPGRLVRLAVLVLQVPRAPLQL